MSLIEQSAKWARKYLKIEPKERLSVNEDGEVYSELNAAGAEVLDDTPIEPPIGYNPQVPLHLQIREMVRSARLAEEAAAAGMETFEEADDFDVDDDFDPSTPWENDFDPTYSEIVKVVEEEKARAKAAKPGHGAKAPSGSEGARQEPPGAPPQEPSENGSTSAEVE